MDNKGDECIEGESLSLKEAGSETCGDSVDCFTFREAFLAMECPEPDAVKFSLFSGFS